MPETSRTVQRITDRLAQKTTTRGHDRLTIWERESPGFCLRIARNGAKSYAVARRIRGQAAPVRITLPQIGLVAARAEARRLIELMRKGIDPRPMLAGEREAAKAKAEKLAANTFAARWSVYDAKHISTLKERTGEEVRRPYRTHFEPKLGTRPLAEITRGELQESSTPSTHRSPPTAPLPCYGISCAGPSAVVISTPILVRWKRQTPALARTARAS